MTNMATDRLYINRDIRRIAALLKAGRGYAYAAGSLEGVLIEALSMVEEGASGQEIRQQVYTRLQDQLVTLEV